MLFSAGMKIRHLIFLIIPALIGGVLLILAETILNLSESTIAKSLTAFACILCIFVSLWVTVLIVSPVEATFRFLFVVI